MAHPNDAPFCFLPFKPVDRSRYAQAALKALLKILFLAVLGVGLDWRHQEKVQEAVAQIERCGDDFSGARNYPAAGRLAEVEKSLEKDECDDEGNGVEAKIVVHFFVPSNSLCLGYGPTVG